MVDQGRAFLGTFCYSNGQKFSGSGLLAKVKWLVGASVLAACTSVPAWAAPLTCSSIYVTDNGGTPVYNINTSNAVLTQVGSLRVASQIGIAAIPGTTPTLYSDAPGNPLNLQWFDGSVTTAANNTTAVKFSSTYGGGLGVTSTGQLFYITTNGTNQVVWRFATPTTTAAQLAVTSGDATWNGLRPGDMMSDANGRLYYFGAVGGNTTQNYLYYVDSTNAAHRLGSYVGPSAGVGVAFDPGGNIYTIHGAALYKIDLTNGFQATSVGTAKLNGVVDNSLIDLASCALPNMNPQISAVKTVRDVTTSQSPALTVNTNDILEYSALFTNTGNLPSDGTRFIDLIPPGTTYVLGSTKLCNSTGVTCTAVADIASAAPFLGTGALVNTPGQAAGIVLTGASNGAVIKFQVKVTSTGTPASIVNTGQAQYPTVATGGIVTINTINTTSTNVPFNFPANPIADTGTGTYGVASTPIANVAANDTVGGVQATLGTTGNSTVAVSGTWPAGLTLNPATGAVNLASNVAPGTYSIDYQLCDKITPTPNCRVVTDTVTVSPAMTNLSVVKTNSANAVTVGSDTTYVITVTNNGPDTVTGAIIRDAPQAGLLCPAANSVAISGSGVPSGSFTFSDLVSGITLGTLTAGQSTILTLICTGAA